MQRRQGASLVREPVDKQGGRTGVVTAPVIFGRVQISLRVAGVVGAPQGHGGTGDGDLHEHTGSLISSASSEVSRQKPTTALESVRLSSQSDCLSAFYLKDIRFVDEAHEGQEAAVRPPVDGDSTQVHKLVLVGHVVQPFHLVLDLHFALRAGGSDTSQVAGKKKQKTYFLLQNASVNVCHLSKGPVCNVYVGPPSGRLPENIGSVR